MKNFTVQSLSEHPASQVLQAVPLSVRAVSLCGAGFVGGGTRRTCSVIYQLRNAPQPPTLLTLLAIARWCCLRQSLALGYCGYAHLYVRYAHGGWLALSLGSLAPLHPLLFAVPMAPFNRKPDSPAGGNMLVHSFSWRGGEGLPRPFFVAGLFRLVCAYVFLLSFCAVPPCQLVGKCVYHSNSFRAVVKQGFHLVNTTGSLILFYSVYLTSSMWRYL